MNCLFWKCNICFRWASTVLEILILVLKGASNSSLVGGRTLSPVASESEDGMGLKICFLELVLEKVLDFWDNVECFFGEDFFEVVSKVLGWEDL